MCSVFLVQSNTTIGFGSLANTCAMSAFFDGSRRQAFFIATNHRAIPDLPTLPPSLQYHMIFLGSGVISSFSAKMSSLSPALWTPREHRQCAARQNLGEGCCETAGQLQRLGSNMDNTVWYLYPTVSHAQTIILQTLDFTCLKCEARAPAKLYRVNKVILSYQQCSLQQQPG